MTTTTKDDARRDLSAGLTEALRAALAPLGIANPEWVEQPILDPPHFYTASRRAPLAMVALDWHVEDVGDAESGPRVSAHPTRWVEVDEAGPHGWTLRFLDFSGDDEDEPYGGEPDEGGIAVSLLGLHATSQVGEVADEVAAILRAVRAFGPTPGEEEA